MCANGQWWLVAEFLDDRIDGGEVIDGRECGRSLIDGSSEAEEVRHSYAVVYSESVGSCREYVAGRHKTVQQ